MNNRIWRVTKLAALSASFLILLACSMGGLIPTRKARSGGPILEILTGDSVDEQGQLANIKFTFAPVDPQVAVVIQIDPTSQLSNAPLSVTWSALTFDGETQLFTDQLQVQPGDRAFSIGRNPGTLAPGMYKVTASLAGQTQDAYVNVAQSASPQSGPAPVASAQAATGQPPTQGGSGRVPQSAHTQTQAPSTRRVSAAPPPTAARSASLNTTCTRLSTPPTSCTLSSR